MKQPFFTITHVDPNLEKNITGNFEKRLISMTITETRGITADTIEIKLDDSDGKLGFPERGIKLNVSLGWKNQKDYNYIISNIFIIDSYEHTGTPDVLTIRGRSANLRDTLVENKDDSYDQMTIGEIVSIIAARNNLKYVIDEDIKSIILDHMDQTKESDASFLTRIIEDVNGIVAIKKDKLLIFKRGQGIKPNGEKLESMTIMRKSGDNHKYIIDDRSGYKGVKTFWYHYKNPTPMPIKIRYKKQLDKSKEVLIGTTEKVKVIRYAFANEASAKRAAESELAKIKSGTSHFEINLAEARPDLITEMPIKVYKFKDDIDSEDWTIIECKHSLTGVTGQKGFSTRITLEITPGEQIYQNIL